METLRKFTAPLALGLTALLASCDTESPAGEAARETLPNGAMLVRHTDLPAIDAVGPNVAEARVDLRFGSRDGADPNLVFADIRGVQAADDGTIYVADAQATEVRAYDPDGHYLQTVVRQGEGPGEITSTNGMVLVGDTVLWLNDHGKWMVIGVDRAGEEVHRFAKPISSYGYIWDGAFDDQERYWRRDFDIEGGFAYPPPPGLSSNVLHHYYVSYDLASQAIDSVQLGQSADRSYTYRDPSGIWQYLPIDFEPEEMMVLNPFGGFWRASSASYRIARTSEDGDTVVVIEADLPVQLVTEEDRAAYVEERAEYWSDARSELEAVAAVLADVKPMLAGMFVDDEGVLWVERVVPRGASAFYDRFSADGDYLGSVRLAFDAARNIVWVQHGSVYSWVVDELDVPYVVRARLTPT